MASLNGASSSPMPGASSSSTTIESKLVKRRAPRKAQVRPPDVPPELTLSQRQEQQRKSVERFNHRTFRTDWDALVRELFVRVVDGCPFAVGLFTRDDTWGVPRMREMLNFNGGRDKLLYYVRRHFKRTHYDHIANSLDGLAPHERYDLYKIVSPGLGLPLNSLVYKIEHYSEPHLKAVIVFGGERLGGQMEVHLKLTAGILEAPPKILHTELHKPEDSRYAKLIIMLRAADPRKLRKAGLNARRWSEIHEIVSGLEGMHEQFPEILKTKFITLSKLLKDAPRLDAPEEKPQAPKF